MLIANGTVITEKQVWKADLRIAGEVVVELAPGLAPEAGEEVIDATGLYVLPGGVDAHTHMDLLVGNARATDSFRTGSIAAACGGTTTIIDHMAFGPVGCGLTHQLDVYHQLAAGQAVIDYGFHGVVDHVDQAVLDDLEELVRRGVSSVKFYMTYERRLSDDEIVALLGRCRELGILVCAHCEDHEMLEGLRQGFVREGKLSCRYHALSRPPAAEAKAVAHLIELAARAGDAPVYIVHTSSAEGLEAALPLPDNVFLETCPQYLLLNDSLYDAPDGEGLKYIMSPPLRKPSDQEALWAAIKAGHINVIATDHCPWNFAKEKQLGKGDFTLCPNGAPGVELRMPLMYTEAVIKRGINLSRFVDICCAAPAKRFGLYPRKGTLAPGSDADVVLFDTLQQMVRHERLHENVDYTPYEGMIVCGYPVMTLSRGKIMMRNGEYCGGEAHGRYLHRDVS